MSRYACVETAFTFPIPGGTYELPWFCAGEFAPLGVFTIVLVVIGVMVTLDTLSHPAMWTKIWRFTAAQLFFAFFAILMVGGCDGGGCYIVSPFLIALLWYIPIVVVILGYQAVKFIFQW